MVLWQDYTRTYPRHPFFAWDSEAGWYSACAYRESLNGCPAAEPSYLRGMRRVLKAFALSSSNIGYCQGLNYIVGFILLVMNTNGGGGPCSVVSAETEHKR